MAVNPPERPPPHFQDVEELRPREGLTPRAYQLEMVAESMLRNIIVAYGKPFQKKKKKKKKQPQEQGFG